MSMEYSFVLARHKLRPNDLCTLLVAHGRTVSIKREIERDSENEKVKMKEIKSKETSNVDGEKESNKAGDNWEWKHKQAGHIGHPTEN